MLNLILRIALRFVVLAAIIGLVAYLVPGLKITGGAESLIWLAIVYSILNLILGTVLRILTLPLIVLTLGLFMIVVNAILLWLAAVLTGDLHIEDLWSGLLGAFLIAFFSWLAELVLPLRVAGHRR